MFNFSGSEIVFLLLLALIVLGPEKLPEAVRKFGKTYGEFKKMTTGFQSELKSALDEPMREMRETADAFKKAASFDFDADPDPEPKPKPTPPPAATESPATFSAAPPLKPAEPVAPVQPVATGLDALVIRDAPVQGGAEPELVAEVQPEPAVPPIAGPVRQRAPRKNTAASFRRAPKSTDDGADDAEAAPA
ncbi:MAG: tatB [Ilumatobacteraceae bacterium]|nr:tatB [Ilumatobacteraceae bacterium]